MENYKLDMDEVVLYKGLVTPYDKKIMIELILTNKSIVFINKHQKAFSNNEESVVKYPTSSIKMYEGNPQIKTKGKLAEIYLLETEIQFEFASIIELHKFTSEAIKLLTGKTQTERTAAKIKNTISLVNDTLGINIVHDTGDLIKNGIVGNASKITKSIFNKK